MSSFAFYTTKANDVTHVDVHFNLWCHCGWKKIPPFLDIGIKIKKLQEGITLSIQVPFEVQKDEIFDLGAALRNVSVLDAVFNENYGCEALGGPQGKWAIVVEYIDGKPVDKFALYNLSKENNISLNSSGENGKKKSVIIIDIPNDIPERVKDKDVYIRFRLRTPQLSTIIRTYSRPMEKIRGVFSKNYVIDFRYNDARSFSPDELEKLHDTSRFVLTDTIHFLLMSKAYVDVSVGSSDVQGRELESNVWDSYVNMPKSNKNPTDTLDTTDVVAYHVSRKSVNKSGKEDGWVFFAKESVEQETWHEVGIFLLCTLFITVAVNLLSNWIYDLLRN